MSDESSPADTAPDADGDDNVAEEDTSDSSEPQLPKMPQNMRASSAEPVSHGLAHVDAKRPLPRQVHSSPGHGHGSEAQPVELDLTPKPLRRQLFPTPEKNQTRSDPTGSTVFANMITHKLPAFVRRSPRINKSKDVFQVPGIAGAIAIMADGKENIVPGIAVDETYDDLFDGPPEDMPMPPSTPKRRSERIIAKTPQRQFGAVISPNVQQSPAFRTPRLKSAIHPGLAALIGTAKKNGQEDMTPMTRAIQDAWDGNGHTAFDMSFLSPDLQRKTPKRNTPNKHVNFDFPDLPSLNNSSPMTSGQIFNMDFSELPTEHLHTDMPDFFNTDITMPSSPPRWDDLFNDEGHVETTGEWLMSENPGSASRKKKETDPAIDPRLQTPRRSPRQNKE